MQDNPRRNMNQRDRQWVVQGYMVWRANRSFVPPTDVVELADRLLVIVEIAGMQPTDFTVSLHNRILTITGERERPMFSNVAHYQVEINYGEFRVEVQLPYAVLHDAIAATYRDGFLQVELPRRQDGQKTIIPVNSESTDSIGEKRVDTEIGEDHKEVPNDKTKQ